MRPANSIRAWASLRRPRPERHGGASAGFVEHAGRQIAVAAVADDEHDGGVLDAFGDAQSRHQRPCRRNAAENAFFGSQPPRHGFGFDLGYGLIVSDQDAVENAGLVGLGPFADARDLRTVGRLRADHLGPGVARLQVGGHAHDGACGAHGADKVADAAFGLRPDFGAGALDVGARVVGVRELVQHLALAFGLHRHGQVARVFHAALAGRRQDEFGAVGGHGGAAFYRQVVGHDQHHAVATHGGRHGQRDAGVAAGGFDERVAGLDLAAFFGAQDHGQRRPVFDRARGVVAFQFGQDDIAPRLARRAGNALQADQRSIADGLFDSGIS